MKNKWSMRLITALLWALATASVVYWGLRLGGAGATRAAPAAEHSAPAGDASTRLAALARVLGATPSTEAVPVIIAPNRFGLFGVVAQGSDGAALLVIDGKPARPYRVGTQLEEGLLLQSVGPRHVVLAASAGGPALHRLELPGPMAANSAAATAAAAAAAAATATAAAAATAPPAPPRAAPQVAPAAQAPALPRPPATLNLQRLRSSWQPAPAALVG
jgi:general secretion pathway protein C